MTWQSADFLAVGPNQHRAIQHAHVAFRRRSPRLNGSRSMNLLRGLSVAVVLSAATQAQDVGLQVTGTFSHPCIPLRCGQGCTGQSVHTGVGTSQIRWGRTYGGANSSLSFVGLSFFPVPIGIEVPVGTVVFMNAVTDLGTEIGTALLNIGTDTPGTIDPFSPRPVCIYTTPNTTGDARLDADAIQVTGVPGALSVPEHGRGGATVYGKFLIEAAGRAGDSNQRVILELTRFGDPAEDAELVDVRAVTVDLRPRRCPNVLNLGGWRNFGVEPLVPVAVMGSDSFDVEGIDLGTVELVTAGGGSATPVSAGLEDVGAPALLADPCDCDMRAPDGIADLLLRFNLRDVAGSVSFLGDGAAPLLTVRGRTVGQVLFQGTECFRSEGSGAAPLHRSGSARRRPG